MTEFEMKGAQGVNENGKIEKALAQTREDLGLCSEFDVAVEEAKNLPLVDRLKYVAQQRNEQRVFDHFEGVLNAPEYVMPDVPEKGDYVRLTMKNGDTWEGEVMRVYKIPATYAVEHSVILDNGVFGYIHDKPDVGIRADWVIVKVEKIDRRMEMPEEGQRITATLRSGKTVTLEWEELSLPGSGNFYSARKPGGGLVFINKPGHDGPDNHDPDDIISWEPAKREWAVGETVPAGTVVGKRWAGTNYRGDVNGYNQRADSTQERTIVWIED